MFDDICEIKNGKCTRHGVVHFGRNYRWSQDKSSIGHSYRSQWDQEFNGIPVDINDICQMDIDGKCLRHKVIHENINYILSQEQSLSGWLVRRQWDRLTDKQCNCKKK